MRCIGVLWHLGYMHETTKRCTKCGEVKEVTGFSKDARKKSGLRPHCKTCNAAYKRASRERIAEYDREYRSSNRQRIAERDRAYYANDPQRRASELIRARMRRALKALEIQKDFSLTKDHNLRTTVAALPPRPSSTAHLDHVCPLAHLDLAIPDHVASANSIDNLQWLDGTRNASKGARAKLSVVENHYRKHGLNWFDHPERAKRYLKTHRRGGVTWPRNITEQEKQDLLDWLAANEQ